MYVPSVGGSSGKQLPCVDAAPVVQNPQVSAVGAVAAFGDAHLADTASGCWHTCRSGRAVVGTDPGPCETVVAAEW